ncbi:ribonuclease H-like domain-containing protein [Tanacetum coccineum]
MSTHPMVTRVKAGIFKLLERMNCHFTTTSTLPRSHVHALRDPNLKEAMLDEYNALITNGTWFIKQATIRNVLSLAVSCDWTIHQLDVKIAFLHGSGIAYLLLYVHDTILTTSSSVFLQRSIASLHKEILERAHMQNCNPCYTPVDTGSKLGLDGNPQVCLYMHDPRDLHFTALKRILRYVRGTLDYGLQLHVSSTTQITAYTDADWAGYPVTLSRYSVEAEYRGVANVVAETAWIRNLLHELHTPLFTATLVYCDNVSAVYMSANLIQHQRTKHIEIVIHFVRDYVASGQVRVLHVPSRFQYTDIFMKGLPTLLFL